MNIPRPIDAELVTLLHEITDDPSQLLAGFTKRLRDTKHELPTALALDEDSFFNQSERRMLRRHREEIGGLLYERCLLFMQEKPTKRGMIDWGKERASGKILARRTKIESASLATKPWEGEAKLEQALSAPIGSNSLIECCELSIRLCPSFRSNSLLVMALKEAAEFKRALKHVTVLAKHVTTQCERSHVLAAESFVLCGLGRFREARGRTEASFRLNDTKISQVLSWVAMELCFGKRSKILDSSKYLETAIEFDSARFGEEEFLEFQNDLREAPSGYREYIDPSQLVLIRSVLDALPSKARRLANAIVQEA